MRSGCSWTYVLFFKQKTAYEMRISDWSSDVWSSDLIFPPHGEVAAEMPVQKAPEQVEQQRSQEYQGEGQMPASRHGKAIMARDCCPIRETRKHQPGVIVIGAELPPIQARVGVEYADRKSVV